MPMHPYRPPGLSLAGCARLHCRSSRSSWSGTYVGIGALAHDYGFSLRLGAAFDHADVGGAGAGHPDLGARHRCDAVRDRHGGHAQCACGFLPMVVALLPLLRGPGTRSRDLCCCRRISPPPACGSNASGCCRRCRANGASRSATDLASASCWRPCRELIGFYLAASLPPLLTRGASVPYADVVSGLDRAQQPHAGRAGSRSASGCVIGPVLTYCAGRARSDVDRDHCRHRGLWHPSPARGHGDDRLGALSPYLALILVGFLPNEIWRLLGIVVARGHR